VAEKVADGERDHQVVGTENTGDVELYGWAPNVDEHADCTGIIYLACINPGRTHVELRHGEEVLAEILEVGTVVRMDDRYKHWTLDDGPRVGVFVGSFPTPCDEWALAALQAGVDALARGDYYGAPRVTPGFRVLQPDECLVPNEAFDGCNTKLLADAIAAGDYIEACVICDKPAVQLDHHWPYFADNCRCADHLRTA